MKNGLDERYDALEKPHHELREKAKGISNGGFCAFVAELPPGIVFPVTFFLRLLLNSLLFH